MSDYRVTGSWQRYQQLPIRALAKGGYERVGIPNPNSGMALFQSNSGTTAPNVHALRDQADAADRADLQRVTDYYKEQEARNFEDLNNPAGLAPSSFMKGVQESMRQGQVKAGDIHGWREYFQNLKNMGVDHLQTAGAASAKQGGGIDRRQIVDYRSQLNGGPQVTGYSSGPNLGDNVGFFDYNPHTSLAEAYQKDKDWALSEEPRDRRDRTKGGYQAQETMSHNLYEQNALRQLRDWRWR